MNTNSNNTTPKNPRFSLASIGHGLKAYLTDWRNLLEHAVLGILLLIVAIWAPVSIWVKLIIIAALITFNILRMKRKHSK